MCVATGLSAEVDFLPIEAYVHSAQQNLPLGHFACQFLNLHFIKKQNYIAIIGVVDRLLPSTLSQLQLDDLKKWV